MEKYFCYGKKDFCDSIDKCQFCKFFDGTGCADGELAHSILSGIFGEDYDLDRLKEQKTQTNADKIRSMTDEELARVMDMVCPPDTACNNGQQCIKCWIDWLKQPAKED